VKKFLIISLNLVLAIGLISCAKTASKPSDVLNLLKGAKTEQDARNYFTKETLKAMDELKKLMPDFKDKKGSPSVGKTDKWEVVKEDIQGDVATVSVKFTDSDNTKKVGTTVPFKFKKEDGAWKLNLEEEMKLGLQMIKGLKGLDVNKMMKDAMKSIK